jgi:hypothetical protein
VSFKLDNLHNILILDAQSVFWTWSVVSWSVSCLVDTVITAIALMIGCSDRLLAPHVLSQWILPYSPLLHLPPELKTFRKSQAKAVRRLVFPKSPEHFPTFA